MAEARCFSTGAFWSWATPAPSICRKRKGLQAPCAIFPACFRHSRPLFSWAKILETPHKASTNEFHVIVALEPTIYFFNEFWDCRVKHGNVIVPHTYFCAVFPFVFQPPSNDRKTLKVKFSFCRKVLRAARHSGKLGAALRFSRGNTNFSCLGNPDFLTIMFCRHSGSGQNLLEPTFLFAARRCGQ